LKITYKHVVNFVLICICAFTLTACKTDEANNTKPPISTTTESASVTFERIIAVIENVDYTNKVFDLVNLETDTKLTLTSELGVQLSDKYGDPITVNQFKKGDIVRVKYEGDTLKPESIAITAEIWEYRNVTGLIFDKENKVVRKGADTYPYTDNLMIIQDDNKIDSDAISNVDMITIKGYKNQIWVVQVDNGHGTLTLKNHKYFIDGMLDIGLETSEVITEDFSIEVPVGVINLRIEKGSFFEEKEVMIERDSEYVLDLSYLDSVVPKLGIVEFIFDQVGVTLYINGRATAYAEQLELPYGDYTVEAKKTGFDDYKEVFRIEEPYVKKDIKLKPSTTNGNTGGTTTEPDPTGNNEGNTQTTTPPTDIAISILAPSGVEIYIDGVFAGTLPKEVKLKEGSHRITLRKDGYTTAEHTIEVKEGMSQLFSFPELTILP
jgi:hypothetical protein